MRSPDEIVRALKQARQANIAVYKRMAELLPSAAKLGWRERQPGDPDVTMLLVEGTIERSQAEAALLLSEVAQNDLEVMFLSQELIRALGSRTITEPKPTKGAVLLPGGGVLHTWVVREALALGLTPIVTDRDENCPCSKIPGVQFVQIDCYDVAKHIDLLDDLQVDLGSHLVGAFCGGAETHEVVAAVHEEMGWKGRWVSKKTAGLCRDKMLMKKTLLKAKVSTARFVKSGDAIVKKLVGSGSRGVFRTHMDKEGWFRPALDLGGKPHLIEELLEGPEQSVEILLGANARGINIVDRHFAWVDDQPLEWGHTNPSRLIPPMWCELYDLANLTAKAFGAEVGFFKIDTIWTKDGPKVLECTPRLSGGFDSQISTPRASGRNLIRYGLQVACGMEPDVKLLEPLPKEARESVTIIHRPELVGSPDQKR